MGITQNPQAKTECTANKCRRPLVNYELTDSHLINMVNIKYCAIFQENIETKFPSKIPRGKN